MRRKSIKLCVDREVPPDFRVAAQIAAVEERADNRPVIDFKLLPPGAAVSSIAALTGKLWKPGRTLRVSFLDGDPLIQQKIQPFAHVWSQVANIKFEFGNDPNAEIRISFKQAGSWSYIGTDALAIPKDKPTMNYGWFTAKTTDDEYSRVVTHEFGHAIGLIHEHQNPAAAIPWNKEVVYNYYKGPPNNWNRATVDTNLFTTYSADQSQFSAFDKQSIMLYPIPKEFVTDPSYEVGWNRYLSDTDKSYIAKLYPFEQKPVTELIIGATVLSASIGSAGESDTYVVNISEAGRYRIETEGYLNTVLDLLGPNNDALLVAQDNNSGWWLNARVEQTLAPGKYTVRVRHFNQQRTGAYKILAVKV